MFKLPNEVTGASLGDMRGLTFFKLGDTMTGILPSLLEPGFITRDFEVVDVLGMPVCDVSIAVFRQLLVVLLLGDQRTSWLGCGRGWWLRWRRRRSRRRSGYRDLGGLLLRGRTRRGRKFLRNWRSGLDRRVRNRFGDVLNSFCRRCGRRTRWLGRSGGKNTNPRLVCGPGTGRAKTRGGRSFAIERVDLRPCTHALLFNGELLPLGEFGIGVPKGTSITLERRIRHIE